MLLPKNLIQLNKLHPLQQDLFKTGMKLKKINR